MSTRRVSVWLLPVAMAAVALGFLLVNRRKRVRYRWNGRRAA